MNDNRKNKFDPCEEHDPLTEALVEFIRSVPQPRARIIDPERYREMAWAASELKELLSETQPEGEITVELLEEFNMGSIRAELPEFPIMDVPRFCRMISKANSFEVSPLTNGNVELSITFYKVMIPID